jgi:hypothetical protein
MLSYWYHCMGKNFPFGLGAILINKEKMKGLLGKEFLRAYYYVQFDTLNAIFMSFEKPSNPRFGSGRGMG